MITTRKSIFCYLFLFVLDLLSKHMISIFDLLFLLFRKSKLLLNNMYLVSISLTVCCEIFHSCLLFFYSCLSFSEFLFIYFIHFHFLLKLTDCFLLFYSMNIVFLQLIFELSNNFFKLIILSFFVFQSVDLIL